jgi:hypothetical protein
LLLGHAADSRAGLSVDLEPSGEVRQLEAGPSALLACPSLDELAAEEVAPDLFRRDPLRVEQRAEGLIAPVLGAIRASNL